MKAPLYILHVEDNADDANLVSHLLESSGLKCFINRVFEEEQFKQGLTEKRLDLVLSDHSMPGFDGLSALKIAREVRPDIPFVFLSGTIGEEVAVECLKLGAADYVIKDRMSRLPSCVRRAVKEAAHMAERRVLESKIREQAALLDLARDAICLHDLSHKILYWNKSAERLYGWKSHEAIGKSAEMLLFRDDTSAQTEALRNLIRKGEWIGELRQFTKDDAEIIVESRWTLVRDSEGAPQSVLVINTDVTEKRSVEERLLRTQRMETIGALAGGIAHDLNNALTPILVIASLLRNSLTDPEDLKFLDTLVASATRGSEMVRQILDFSRGMSGAHKPLRIRSLVEEIGRFAQQTFPRTIKIETRLEKDLPLVIGNSTQLHQVLLNLCVNARDAMPKGGMLRISAESQELKEALVLQGEELHPGRYVVLAVEDTGEGIPPSVRHKIFEPFFTTKGHGKGTGLGLSTALGIIKTHNGYFDIMTEEGCGTTFKVYLPAAENGAA